MYKYVLRSIEGVDIYPVIALVIFFIFFVGLLWWVFKKDGQYINTLSELPFRDDERVEDASGLT
jgi:cbb3-type cytochrome oxidase subunit 3